MNMTGRFLKHQRNKNWNNTLEVNALLDLWEENFEQLQRVKRNWLIYHRMSSSMAKQGFRRSPLEMRKKIANLVSKWKSEKSKPTGWQYFDRMERILCSFPPLPDSTKVQSKIIEPGNHVKNENFMQEILFVTSDDATNAADIEELLKSMGNEEETNKRLPTDGTSQQSLNTPNEDIPVDTTVESSSQVDVIKQPDPSNSGNDEGSNSNIPVAAISGETTRERTQSKPPTDSNMASIISPMKIKTGDSGLLPRIEKTFSITIPKQIVPRKTDTKDEIDLYVELLASKLRNMDEKTRYIAMNRIDNMLFKMKMDLYTDQHV